MTQSVGTSGVSRDDLALHFDGELAGAEAHELAAQIEADPELEAEFAQLGILRGLVSETLMSKAADVPQARFEQIWDEIDRAVDREVRAGETTAAPASIWERMWAALKPARLPIAAAAAAAAVTLIVVNTSGDETSGGANNPGAVASSQEDAEPGTKPTPQPTPPPAADRIAQATPEPTPPPVSPVPAADDMPKPKKVEAEIHGVEFSGRTGRISKTGTVTVLYLEEQVDPKDSERSL